MIQEQHGDDDGTVGSLCTAVSVVGFGSFPALYRRG